MQAFADLFEPLRPAMFSVAYRLVGPDDAEDVVMETFLKAWQALPTFGGRSSMETWLHRIAHNCAVDALRSRDRRKDRPRREGDTDQDALANLPDPAQKRPDEQVAQNETAREVVAVLDELPPEHRATLLLRYADGLEYSEIATATGVSIGTVMSRLFYGKRKMKKLLQGRA
jgi:RNA polymerase sigma-70 factor (ECF subfamily)